MSLLNKFLHKPTARIRAAAEDGREHDVLDAARFLFDLEEDTGGEE